MTPSIAEFEAKGWFLSQEGIDLIAAENDGVSTLEDYIACAKDMDLRLLTTKGFNKTAEKPSEIPSPLVLQVLEVRNVAMPSVNQVEHPRLLSVTFTDGSKKKYKGVEVLGKVDCLKLHTPPGTKFLVKKPIEIRDQILVLGPDMLTEIGGHVQELVQAWRAGKQFLKRYRGKSAAKEGDDESEQGPPAFVPFKVKPHTVDKEPKAKKPVASKDIALTKNDKPVEKRGKKAKADSKQTDNSKLDDKAEQSGGKREHKKETSREKINHKKDAAKERSEQPKDVNSKAKKEDSKSNMEAKKDKRKGKPEKSDESMNRVDKKDIPPERIPLENASNKAEKSERRERSRKKQEKSVEQKDDSLPAAKTRSQSKQSRDSPAAAAAATESGTSSPAPQSGTATPTSAADDKKSSRKKKSPKAPQQEQIDKHTSWADDIVEPTTPVKPKEKPARKKKSTASSTKADTTAESKLEEDTTTSTVTAAAPEKKKKKPRKANEKKTLSEEPNDSDASKQSQQQRKKAKSKSANEKTVPTPPPSSDKPNESDKETKPTTTNNNNKPKSKRERKPRERGQRKEEQSAEKPEDTPNVNTKEEAEASKEQHKTAASSTASPTTAVPTATTPVESSTPQYNSNATPSNSATVDPSYYNANQHQMQQPYSTADYYYHQQAAYAPMVDYNMMVPIDPNTGLPAVMYGYHPDPHHQQQQYMQPMYYMAGQPQQPYYNHQAHYTQLYDQDHYDPHNQYRQQPQHPQNGDDHNRSNYSSRGRGARGRGRGPFKHFSSFSLVDITRFHMARVKFFKNQGILSLLLISMVIFSMVPKVKAWTEADFEIFDIVDALEKAEGKDTNFYNWLGVAPSATQNEISKAYRKLSLKWHPDKNKGDPKAKERFTRLGVIVSILRDPTSRERYNFFYKNGVPRWRGTGYLYSRFRPGLGTVTVVLLLIAAGMQHIAGQINYHQEKRKIAQFVAEARSHMIHDAPKGRAATLGRSYVEVGQRNMRCEVKGDNYIVVYPDERTGEPIHLNTEWVTKPTVSNLFIIAWPKRWIYKALGKKEELEEEFEEDIVEGEEEEVSEKEQKKAADTSNAKKKSLRKRGGGEKVNVMGAKVGGRRRPAKN
ncbi:DnaJ-domain-containing protein [Mucor lusitanicus]